MMEVSGADLKSGICIIVHCSIQVRILDVEEIEDLDYPAKILRVNSIFELSARETLMQYHFCFNFTAEKDQREIKESMGEISSVHFLKFTEDPFTNNGFTDAEKILKEYMPIRVNEEKKGLFRRRLNEK